MNVDCDFPGGNIIVDGIDGDVVSIHQDLRDTSTDWFYWCFRVRGAAGREVTFRFTKGNVIGVRGPAVSTDEGWTWRWRGSDSFENDSFSYTFPGDADDVRFSFGMPYQDAQLQAFLDTHAGSARLTAEHHCTTRKGRRVERLLAGCIEKEPSHRVMLTCRHHCCEMMASYALEGMIETIIEDDRDVEFLIVPFMDKDGAEDGDQGKNRAPHDHGRDYLERIYPTVDALMDLVPSWSKGKFAVALDLHCPWIRGEHNECVYLVGSASKRIWKEQQKFSEILEAEAKGPLAFRASDNLPYGEAWNKEQNFSGGKSCTRWMTEQEGIRLASGMEIPYASANGHEVNQETARELGRDLARALYIYL
jgi:hypothetical protein